RLRSLVLWPVLRHQGIVLPIALIPLLPETKIHVLPAMLRVLSRFGKISIVALDARIFRAVWKLSFKRGLAMLVAILAFDRTLLQIIVLVRHIWLLIRGDGVLPRARYIGGHRTLHSCEAL